MLTPWEVKGDIDYKKLMDEFGIHPFRELPDEFRDNILFTRKIVFAQRDFFRILEAKKQKKPFAMMTGLMPTGKFHIGHMLLAKQFVLYQKLGARVYIAVADIESYNARGQSLEDSRKNAIEEYLKNYIALGLKPKGCTFYFQSQRSKDSKENIAFYQLENLLARHATFNEFRAVYGEISPGKMIASILQGADMLHPQLKLFGGPMPVVIPVGVDQDPHIRLARDMSKRLKIQEFIPLSSTYHKFMPGLGGGKMSASDANSFIALSDSPKTAEQKIKKYAFSGGQATVEEHRKKGGNPDIDISYQYLRMYFEPDDKKLKQIYDDYRSGRMLTGELKGYLIEKVTEFLINHQKKLKEVDIRPFI